MSNLLADGRKELAEIRDVVGAIDRIVVFLDNQETDERSACIRAVRERLRQSLADQRDELIMRAGELALGVDAGGPPHNTQRSDATVEEIAQAIQKLDASEEDEEDEEDAPAPARVPRPDDIPETFVMVKEAIDSFGEDGATIEQICGFIDVKWWPRVQADQIDPSSFRGKFIRHPGGCWFVVDEPRAKAVAAPQPAAKAPMQRAWPKAPAQFVHGENTVMLQPFEYRVAYHLHSAMGKGHIPADLLINSIFAKGETGRPKDPAGWMRICVGSLNSRMRPLGLQIERYPPDGYFMREVSAK